MNEEENFKDLAFIAEACNLGESTLKFIKHTDNYTKCHLLNLVGKKITLNEKRLYAFEVVAPKFLKYLLIDLRSVKTVDIKI